MIDHIKPLPRVSRGLFSHTATALVVFPPLVLFVKLLLQFVHACLSAKHVGTWASMKAAVVGAKGGVRKLHGERNKPFEEEKLAGHAQGWLLLGPLLHWFLLGLLWALVQA